MNLDERMQQITLVLCDVDGVLTDGGIIFDNQGIETKRFHIRDGMGIKIWQESGHQFGLITGRSSHVRYHRSGRHRTGLTFKQTCVDGCGPG